MVSFTEQNEKPNQFGKLNRTQNNRQFGKVNSCKWLMGIIV